MGQSDPRQAVVADLTQPTEGHRRTPEPDGADIASARPVPSLARGKPFAADAGSIEFHKERGTDDRRLFAVSFDDQSGNHWFWLVAAELARAGWTAHGVAGGSDGPHPARNTQSTPSEPWLYLCGHWGADRFYAGGELLAGTARVGVIRLTLADGTQLSDDGEGDVALFVGHRGEPPAKVDIFGVDGSLLSSHKAL